MCLRCKEVKRAVLGWGRYHRLMKRTMRFIPTAGRNRFQPNFNPAEPLILMLNSRGKVKEGRMSMLLNETKLILVVE
ncbi:hypothetical protein ES288_A11G125300v1 [Gossypium darwinii]|uniref:Uncharacterized protein n=1 Tax=Gossypium darwinii TaxID=34276 RepID=A0A5D2EKE3_GOSDA|nr:hypothetical protein ES288_A11G125300v1 [Gossypium darwinii]TYG93629.1 hypothetical protein ES288_A11G125300v1 [Gossypium darwinii]